MCRILRCRLALLNEPATSFHPSINGCLLNWQIFSGPVCIRPTSGYRRVVGEHEASLRLTLEGNMITLLQGVGLSRPDRLTHTEHPSNQTRMLYCHSNI